MRLKCLLSHKWLYKTEKVKFTSPRTLSFPDHTMELTTNVRLCTNCYKKQRVGLMPTQGFSGKTNWVDYDKLSREELRDKKLKEIGI